MIEHPFFLVKRIAPPEGVAGPSDSASNRLEKSF